MDMEVMDMVLVQVTLAMLVMQVTQVTQEGGDIALHIIVVVLKVAMIWTGVLMNVSEFVPLL